MMPGSDDYCLAKHYYCYAVLRAAKAAAAAGPKKKHTEQVVEWCEWLEKRYVYTHTHISTPNICMTVYVRSRLSSPLRPLKV